MRYRQHFGARIPEAAYAPDGGAGSGDDLRSVMATLRQAAQDARQMAEGVRGDARQAREQAADVASRLTDVEQVVARISRGGGGIGQSFGQADAISRAVSESEAFQAFTAGKAKNAVTPISAAAIMPRQTITTAVTDGDIAPPTRIPGISSDPMRRVFVFSLFSSFPVAGSAVELLREASFTNNAQAQAAEGDTKGASDMTLEVESVRVSTYAHTVKASRQALSDQAALQPYLDRRLRFGLLSKTEAAVVSADGTGGTIKGLTHADNHTPAAVEMADAIDTLRYAQEQIEEVDGVASAFVMHPSSWAAIEIQKQGTQDYVIGSPRGGGGRTLWNLPVFTTKSVTAGNFLCLDAASVLWGLREDASLEAGYVNDDFVKNLVTFRCEWRPVLLVPQPHLVVYGALSGS